MRSYTDPEMRVNLYDTESVVTQASGQPDTYDSWKQEQGQVQETEVRFNDFRAITGYNM